MKKLTPKKEKFSQLTVKYSDQSKALRESHDCSNMTDKTINEKACRLAKDDNVSARIEEIKEDLKEENKITRQTLIDYHQRMIDAWQELWKLGQKEKLTADQKTRFYLLKELVKGSDMRGSTDSIAKLTGLNEPDKIEHKHEIVAHKTKWS